MWTGWVGNDGKNGGPVITNAELGYDWSTYPERLQRNGISWKVYQDVGVGLDAKGFWGWTDDPFIGNYGDNSLLYFHQYQNAQPGDPLADFAKTGTNINKDTKDRDPRGLLEIFRRDVQSGKLPQVSWIVAPEAYSEHPNFAPDYGAWYVSQFVDILASNPEVWSKTVLFINYDEEGGFFDHMVPPTPPMSPAQGASTVDTVNEIYPGDSNHPSAPYGLGMRVPLIIASPWTKGGWVNSQVFDQTSLIRFIEARFANGNPDLIESNITAWRRAVVGDLTSAFDFANPNARRVRLPSTAAYLPPVEDRQRRDDQVPVPPADQTLPKQEPGVRPARALPYALHAHGRIETSTGSFRIEFGNTGGAAAVFHVRSGNATHQPRSYTVGSQKRLSDTWTGGTDYDLSVYGPNGFFRGFKGSIPGPGKANLEVGALCDHKGNGITLSISNRALQPAKIRIRNQYTGRTFEQVLDAGESRSKHWRLILLFGWYDLVITVDGDPGFEYRFAGHVETGRDSISDPALGGWAWSGARKDDDE
jgi:phospholipase C